MLNNETKTFFDIIEKFKKNKTVIVVEGIKDKNALNFFGLNEIIVFHGKPFYKAIEKIILATKKNKASVAILTDNDKMGKELYIKIKKELLKEGLKIDDTLRNFFNKMKISHMEGLTKQLFQQKWG